MEYLTLVWNLVDLNSRIKRKLLTSSLIFHLTLAQLLTYHSYFILSKIQCFFLFSTVIGNKFQRRRKRHASTSKGFPLRNSWIFSFSFPPFFLWEHENVSVMLSFYSRSILRACSSPQYIHSRCIVSSTVFSHMDSYRALRSSSSFPGQRLMKVYRTYRKNGTMDPPSLETLRYNKIQEWNEQHHFDILFFETCWLGRLYIKVDRWYTCDIN